MTSSPDALPERVRARVIAFAADALGALPSDHVPGPLKRAASFTPQRRVRLAGQQILDQVASDETFRERVGVQARARQRDVAAQLAEGAATAETAALAYLIGAEDWRALVARAAEDARGSDDVDRLRAEVEVLRRRLEAADAEQAAARKAAKAELKAAKGEIAELRRKLGDARAQARTARAEADQAASDGADRVARLESDAAAADAEIRRLKAQVAGVETELARAQRAARAGRDEGTLRARLLLDTLLQAGQGLRQELALPVVEGVTRRPGPGTSGRSGSAYVERLGLARGRRPGAGA